MVCKIIPLFRCDPGFDGGHPPIYVMEVSLYTTDEEESTSNIAGNKNIKQKIGKRVFKYNISSSDGPHFELDGLAPGIYTHILENMYVKIIINIFFASQALLIS